MRHALSPVLYGVLAGLGVARVLRQANRDRVAILAYHGLHAGECGPVDNFDGLLLHADRFAWQMRYLARHYHVVPLDDCLASDGRPHRVVITFDDAYGSVHTHAFPILEALRLPATVFVPTDFVAGRRMMWWDRLRTAIGSARTPLVQVEIGGGVRAFATASPADKLRTIHALHALLQTLGEEERTRVLERLGGPETPDALRAPLTVAQMRDMAAHGISFQSHGTSHRSFRTLGREEVWREARQSKRLIEAWIGQEVSWLAYPFGDTGPDADQTLARCGYRGAVTMREGLARADERLRLPRLAIGDPIGSAQFTAALCGLRAALAPALRRLATRR